MLLTIRISTNNSHTAAPSDTPTSGLMVKPMSKLTTKPTRGSIPAPNNELMMKSADEPNKKPTGAPTKHTMLSCTNMSKTGLVPAPINSTASQLSPHQGSRDRFHPMIQRRSTGTNLLRNPQVLQFNTPHLLTQTHQQKVQHLLRPMAPKANSQAIKGVNTGSHQ